MSAESGCIQLLPLPILVLTIGLLVLIGIRRSRGQKELREAHQSYSRMLELLKMSPTDPDLRQKTLAWGRHYSNLTRQCKGVTLFDEVALANDINAACAAAGLAPAANALSALPSAVPTVAVEERLARLKYLLDNGAITEQEYREKRSRILDEL